MKVPEIVNIRLTKNLVNGLGALRENGIFLSEMIELFEFYKKNTDKILSFLEIFSDEPLDEQFEDNTQ